MNWSDGSCAIAPGDQGPTQPGGWTCVLNSDYVWMAVWSHLYSRWKHEGTQPEEGLVVNNLGIRRQGKGFLQGSIPGLLPPGLP